MFWVMMTGLHAAEVAGVIEGADPGGEVVIEAIDPSLRVVGSATAAGDGTFTLTGVPAVPFRLRATPLDEHGVPDAFYPAGDAWCEGALVDLAHGEAVDEHRIALQTGGTLTGTVLISDGSPATGAHVVAFAATDEPVSWQRVAEVGDDGHFTLSGLPTTAAGVRVELIHDDQPDTLIGGYDLVEAEEFAFTDGEVRDLGELSFGPGVTAGGQVLDDDGLPVADVTVRVRIGAVTERVATDVDGRWTVAGIRAGDAEIWIAEDGWAVSYWPDEDRPSELIHLTDDGDIVDDVTLYVTPESTVSGVITGGPSELEGLTLKAVNDDGSVRIKVEVDSDGYFTAHRLASGSWSLLVEGQDHGGVEDSVRDDQGRVRTWQVDAGEALDVGELPWIAEAVLEGRVFDPSGRPVQGVTVTAVPDAEDLPQLFTTTDDHGRYRLPSLVEGPYRLLASVEALCTEDPDYVDAWWPDARLHAQAQVLRPEAAAELGDVDLVVPVDVDHDGMDDAWEQSRGLDPTRDDGAEDPDGDGYSNLEEYQLGTNPTAQSDEGALGGCNNPLSLSFLLLPLVGLGRRRNEPQG